MNFKDYLQITAKEIDKELEMFFTKWGSEVEQISPRLLPHAKALTEACRGGKRIRGTLVKLGYEISHKGTSFFEASGRGKGEGGGEKGEIINVAVAFEIFQASILAHDDIIDKSLLRRGKPSLYSQLGGDQIGISKAICLGDIGFFLAFRLIATSGFPDKEKNRTLGYFSEMMLDTGIGELLDVELTNRVGDGVLMKDVITVYKFKTAYYTIAAPLIVGAVLGGVENNKLESISIFGQNLGIAFQIQDDIDDIFLEKKVLEKELGGDIKEGKQTLLYVYAQTNANKKQRDFLKKYYGNSVIGQEEINIIKKVFEDCGALDHASFEARKYAQKAKDVIPDITKNEKLRKMFFEMTEYFVNK